MKKCRLLAVLIMTCFWAISCGEDDGGTNGGSGVADTNPLAAKAAAPEAAPQTAQQEAPAAAGSNNFSLLFEQTTQTCADCGIWFDSAELVVQHSGDNSPYRKSQAGSLLIKKSSGKVGRFQADLSSIPASATIQQATLYMLLNHEEGIANRDKTSVIAVYDTSEGRKGRLVRRITAARDIKGRGYSKANPNVPIDFTAYATQLRSR